MRRVREEVAEAGRAPARAGARVGSLERDSLLMKKVGFISLGCPKNLVDSEVMMGELAREGYEITRDAADADTLVVNTCGFIDAAKKESIDAILEAGRLKPEG